MKAKHIILALGCGGLLLFSPKAYGQQQDPTVVEFTDITIEQVPDCQTHYYSSWKNNWFIQLGAGIQIPYVESYMEDGDAKRKATLSMNFGVGRWMSPYLGFRFSAIGGALHWEDVTFSKAKYANLNVDLMWDMFNSMGSVNSKRVFSIIPFIGVGGTYVWDINSGGTNIQGKNGLKTKSWTLPASAGLQLRLRLFKALDFFAEGRAQFYGDNFNNCAQGKPVDINIIVLGGFSINLGERTFNGYNPCTYLNYINSLNGQVNDMRAQLAACAADLAAAVAQLPCPEVVQPATPKVAAPSLLATVRFTINSSKISKEEMVNVYNVAQWLKANPDATISINGYADKETGTTQYNQELSQKRSQAVYDALVNQYDIAPSRLTVKAFGSATQPYGTNNWNRIVIFRDN